MAGTEASGGPAANFDVDEVLGASSSQADVWDCVSPAVEAVLSGADAALLLYGQSGAGKTHSLLGTQADPGIAPRAANMIFRRTTDGSAGVVCSAVLVRERAPLVDPYRRSRVEVELIGTSGEVVDWTEVEVADQAGLRGAMQMAEDRRAAEEGRDGQARHLVIRVRVDWFSTGRQSSLWLVDLAGSCGSPRGPAGEAVAGRPGAGVGAGRPADLTALDDVLAAHRRAATAHIPYRHAKLTQVLQPVLSTPGVRLLVLVLLSPDWEDRAASLAALQFGERCRQTVLRPGS